MMGPWGFDRIPPTLELTRVGGRIYSNRDKGLGLGYIVGLGFFTVNGGIWVQI